MIDNAPPLGWVLDVRSDAQRKADMERQRQAALKGCKERVAGYVAAWRRFVAHVTQPDLLAEFVRYRVWVAQTWQQHTLGRRDSDLVAEQAPVLAATHGPTIRACAERWTERDVIPLRDWVVQHGPDTQIPDLLVKAGEPLALAIQELLNDTGLARPVDRDRVEANLTVESLAKVRHCALAPVRWPGGEFRDVEGMADIGGQVFPTKLRAWVPGPISAPWRDVVDSATVVQQWDILRVMRP